MLVVHNSVQTSNSGQITITSTGSLQLHIEEGDGHGLMLQGAGIVNESRIPQNLSVSIGANYAGIPTSSIDVENDFYGTIYLPNDTMNVPATPIFSVRSSRRTLLFSAILRRCITMWHSSKQILRD